MTSTELLLPRSSHVRTGHALRQPAATTPVRVTLLDSNVDLAGALCLRNLVQILTILCIRFLSSTSA